MSLSLSKISPKKRLFEDNRFYYLEVDRAFRGSADFGLESPTPEDSLEVGSSTGFSSIGTTTEI